MSTEVMLVGAAPGRENSLMALSHDFTDSCAARGTGTKITWSTSPADYAGSDVIVVTSGVPRKEGQDRTDLALENARIIAPIAEQIGKYAPGAIILMIANPLDGHDRRRPEVFPDIATVEYSGYRFRFPSENSDTV